MSEEVEVAAGPEVKTLPLLTEWVRTMEAAFGPILRIGTKSGNNAGSFDWDNPANPKPVIEADLKTIATGAAKVDGELCRGIVFIGDALIHVAVIRPAA